VRQIRGSLAWRLALLVVVTVLVNQLFTWWLVTYERRELVTRQFNAQIVDTIVDLQRRLKPIPVGQRNTFLAHEYNGPGLIQLVPTAAYPTQAVRAAPSAMERSLVEKLQTALNQPLDARVLTVQSRKQLWITVQILGAPYWLVIPLGHFRQIVFSSMMLAALLASIIAMTIAAVIAWRTIRPISNMVSATQELAKGRMPPPLNEGEGPKEIQNLSRGFNLMAQAIDHSASERRLMLAGLSHDLRTPLTRLKLMVEMQDEAEDKQGMLSDIDEISDIVRQFIDFARSEEKPRNQPVALAELAGSVVARFAREEVGIRLDVLAEPEIMADPLALQRLLSNLLDNARRYGKEPIEVRVAVEQAQAMLTISDHGEGIPAALRQAALTPFERLAKHRGTDGGSGLGLSIVSRIVHQHGGTLTLDDTPGGGLQVRVGLPLPPL